MLIAHPGFRGHHGHRHVDAGDHQSYSGLVVDDYYKKGKQINRVLARDRLAWELGLAAELRVSAAMTRSKCASIPRSVSFPGERHRTQSRTCHQTGPGPDNLPSTTNMSRENYSPPGSGCRGRGAGTCSCKPSRLAPDRITALSRAQPRRTAAQLCSRVKHAAGTDIRQRGRRRPARVRRIASACAAASSRRSTWDRSTASDQRPEAAVRIPAGLQPGSHQQLSAGRTARPAASAQ